MAPSDPPIPVIKIIGRAFLKPLIKEFFIKEIESFFFKQNEINTPIKRAPFGVVIRPRNIKK